MFVVIAPDRGKEIGTFSLRFGPPMPTYSRPVPEPCSFTTGRDNRDTPERKRIRLYGLAKAGHLCISKKGMGPLLQVVTSDYSPELMGLT